MSLIDFCLNFDKKRCAYYRISVGGFKTEKSKFHIECARLFKKEEKHWEREKRHWERQKEKKMYTKQ